LIPAGERLALVGGELAQELAEIENADLDVPGRRPRDRMAGEHGLDVVPGDRKNLHNAPRACSGCEIRLEPGFHPGDGAYELLVDAVARGPSVEQRPNLRGRRK